MPCAGPVEGRTVKQVTFFSIDTIYTDEERKAMPKYLCTIPMKPNTDNTIADGANSDHGSSDGADGCG